jgi:hypothetical protein
MKKTEREIVIKAGRAELAAWLRAAEKHGKIYYDVKRVRTRDGGVSNRIVLRTIRFVKGRPELSILWPNLPNFAPVATGHYAAEQEAIAKDWCFSFRRRAFVTYTMGMDEVNDLVHDLARLAGMASRPDPKRGEVLYISRVQFEAFAPS